MRRLASIFRSTGKMATSGRIDGRMAQRIVEVLSLGLEHMLYGVGYGDGNFAERTMLELTEGE
jgi:hypothetical protein